MKSYIQLWNSEGDPRFRSFVFSYDRPCYPGYDMPGELVLHHLDNKIEEEIRPIYTLTVTVKYHILLWQY